MLNVYLDEKETSVKIQLPNIFKDHHIVAQPTPATLGYDKWPLSLALSIKFYNSHGKYKSKLNEYFHMYRCRLNFSLFAVTNVLGISWKHLNHPNLLVSAVYRFHVYFHVRLILHELRISLPHKDGFSKVKNDYERCAYYSVCYQFGLNPDETWMYGDWFYLTDYAIVGHEVKSTEGSLPDNLTRWTITQSKGFTRKSIEKISRSGMKYVYLVLICQVQTRSTIVGNSVPAVDAQQLFKDMFKSLINEDLSTDIEKYQGVLEHALSKVDFSVGTGIYMLPSNLNLNIRYNNKIVVSNTGIKIGSNKDINRDHKKLPSDMLIPVTQHDLVGGTRPHNLRMLTEKHNDEKLVITLLIIGTGLIAYHFW